MKIVKYSTKAVLLGCFILLLMMLGQEEARAQSLTSIDVTPANPTITVGQTQPFIAMGTFSDSSSRVLNPASHIAVGGFHTCAVLYDGRVLCWGDNRYGQLGLGGTSDPIIPAIEVIGITNAKAVAAGADRTCAILADGTVKCWGLNQYGTLGNGTYGGPDCGGYCNATPVTVSGISTATAIAMGTFHTCAVLSDGTVKCWGDNFYGQLGNGVHTDANSPVSVNGISTATAIAAGDGYTCVLLSNGTVKCWGRNRHGQLGKGDLGTSDIHNSDTPVLVIGITTATAIAAEGEHVCALLSDGTVKCWGENANGQLGNGTTIDYPTPVSVSGISTAIALDSGGEHTCAQLSDGTVRCWGYNAYGQLGNQSLADFHTPVSVFSMTTAAAIAAGGNDTCAVLSDGEVKCWGENDTGGLGNGILSDSSVPVSVIGISSGVFTATAVAAGHGHTCAVLSDGTVKCWGDNGNGQLGDGTLGGPDPPCLFSCNSAPSAVADITTATTVAAGVFHTCARLSDGSVNCWGGNEYSQLGYGTSTGPQTCLSDGTPFYCSDNPILVIGINTATTIAGGSYHTCAVLTDGTVKCWGSNSSGQLGNGTTTDSPRPVSVAGITNAVAIAAGGSHTCAMLTDGTVKCWGSNSSGQLGNGTTTDSPTPVSVAGITNAVAIAAGGLHTCAVLSDGTANCWGYNRFGQLGNGTTTGPQTCLIDGNPYSCSTTPVAVSDVSTATAVAGGELHSCARLSDGTVNCWGRNFFGQLGNGTATDSPTPVTVNGISTATAIAAGSGHTCAVLSDGTVKCWGKNANGQLGMVYVIDPSIPVTVGTTVITAVLTSSDAGVATINANGVAAGFSPGTTTITATWGGISGSTTLTVVNLNTPTGSNVVVSAGSGVTVTFSGVTASGDTTVTTSGTGPAPPAGFQLGIPPTYYDITTTAAFTPPVTVCLTYNPAQYTDINALSLLHYESGNWVDVTTSNDTVNDIICGQVNGFSLFVIAEAVSPPVGPSPRIYFSNQDSANPSIGVLDPSVNTVVGMIPVTGAPSELVADPSGAVVYAMTGTNLSVIDAPNHELVNILPGVGDFLYQHLAISPDGKKLYLLYRQLFPGTLILKVFNTTDPVAPTLMTTVSDAMFNACYAPLGLAVSPNGNQLYLACRQSASGVPDRFFMVDTATNTPTLKASFPRDSGNYYFINALAVTPHGSKVYLARTNTNGASTVEYFDGTTGAHLGAISLPANATPRAAVFTPDGSKLYVVDQTLGTHVIDPATNTRTKTMSQTNSRGVDITILANGGHAYTGNITQISDLDVSSDSGFATISGGISPWQITETPGLH